MRFVYSVLTLALLAGCTATAAGTVSPGTPSAAPSTAPSATPTATPSAVPSDVPQSTTTVSNGCDADFAAFDTDKSGKLNADEYADGRYSQVRFIKAPTADEVAAMKEGFRQEHKAKDADGDGALDLTEFRTTCAS